MLTDKKERLDFSTRLGIAACVNRIRGNAIITKLSHLGIKTPSTKPIGDISGDKFLLYKKPLLNLFLLPAYYGKFVEEKGHTKIEGHFGFDPLTRRISVLYKLMFFIFFPVSIIISLIYLIINGAFLNGIIFFSVGALMLMLLYLATKSFEKLSGPAWEENKAELINFIEATLEAQPVAKPSVYTKD